MVSRVSSFAGLALALMISVPGALGQATNTTEIITAFDPYADYVPFLIWFGLVVLFLYFTAWFPAVVSMMAMANALLATPVWGLPASAMMLAFACALHVLVTQGAVPRPWRKNR